MVWFYVLRRLVQESEPLISESATLNLAGEGVACDFITRICYKRGPRRQARSSRCDEVVWLSGRLLEQRRCASAHLLMNAYAGKLFIIGSIMPNVKDEPWR
jgi:hypothetical protein